MCMWHSCYQTWRCFFFKDSFIEDFTVNKTNRKPNRMGFQCEHLFGFSSLKKNKHQLFMFISIRKIYCRLCTFVGFFFFFLQTLTSHNLQNICSDFSWYQEDPYQLRHSCFLCFGALLGLCPFSPPACPHLSFGKIVVWRVQGGCGQCHTERPLL